MSTLEDQEKNEKLVCKTGDATADDNHAYLELYEPVLPDKPVTGAKLEDLPLWRAAKSLKKLRNQIDNAHPKRSKAKDGFIGNDAHCSGTGHTGESDHCLNIYHDDEKKHIVVAVDITHDPSNGCDVEKIVEAIRGDKDSRIAYIIWNKRICNSKKVGSAKPWEWRKYEGNDGHTGHAHFSAKHERREYDNESAWMIK